MQKKKNQNLWGFLGIVLFVVPIILLAKNIHQIEPFIKSVGIAGPFVMLIIYVLLAITPITTDPLTVISGAMFGPLIGIGISFLGNTGAAMVEYFFGKKVGHATNFEEMRHNLPWGLGKLPVSSPWFLILGRMVPSYGGKIISILAGMYNVPIFLYLWTTAVTNLFGAIMLSYGGYQLLQFLKMSL